MYIDVGNNTNRMSSPKRNEPDALSRNMQIKAISIASERLGRPLTQELIDKIRHPGWSYMGHEMIIDTVSTIEASEIEGYISRLY